MAEPGVPAAQVDHHREPCPDRILDDLGGAFSMGAVGGGLFHSVKQMWWSPRGHKFRSAFEVCVYLCFNVNVFTALLSELRR